MWKVAGAVHGIDHEPLPMSEPLPTSFVAT